MLSVYTFMHLQFNDIVNPHVYFYRGLQYVNHHYKNFEIQPNKSHQQSLFSLYIFLTFQDYPDLFHPSQSKTEAFHNLLQFNDTFYRQFSVQ